MGRKTLDKIATKKAIVRKAQSAIHLSIDEHAFDRKIQSVKDIKEACVFVRIEPIYC